LHSCATGLVIPAIITNHSVERRLPAPNAKYRDIYSAFHAFQAPDHRCLLRTVMKIVTWPLMKIDTLLKNATFRPL
jgi:hypothetical protein